MAIKRLWMEWQVDDRSRNNGGLPWGITPKLTERKPHINNNVLLFFSSKYNFFTAQIIMKTDW